VSQSKSLQNSSSAQSAAQTDATTTVTHRRKHNQTHLLLTPPLTPSSSIQTTGSTDTDATSTNEPEEGHDNVEPQSRFLIVNVRPFGGLYDITDRFLSKVNNVPRTADADTVKNAFMSLLSPSLDILPSKQTHPKDDPIKGIFVRFQATHGVVILAFFDTRQAAKVVKLMTNAVAARLFIAMGGTAEEGVETALQCRFLSVDGLCKVISFRFSRVIFLILLQLIGKSSFVEETNGQFFISVEERESCPEPEGTCSVDVSCDANVGIKDGDIPIGRSTGARKLEPAKLRSVLESFGDILSLNSLESEDQDQVGLSLSS
jgi:hypothetical protein